MIDAATTPSTATHVTTTPNYPQILPICDLLNSSPSSPTLHTHYIKAVKKKLSTKSTPTINLTLDLIEITVKNCAEKSELFQKSVMNRGFLEELVRVMGTSPIPTQDKILSLIQSFYDNFKTDHPDVGEVYHDLKDKGVEFPGVDFDGGLVPMVMKPHINNHVPIVLPVDHAEEETPILHPVRFNNIKPIQPTPEQKGKILKDLDIVRMNLQVLNEVVSEDLEGDEEWGESLYSTTLKMQSRLTTLLSQLDDGEDAFLSELLQVNDEMNNAFLRYTRWMKNHQKKKQESTTSLIDFNTESTAVEGAIPKFRRLSDEILKPAPPVPATPPQSTQLTPSEFDKFLEERLKK
ncbi:TOM1-like protein 1 isoform X2 [Folsomia candida]|uniref:TOM1-like protein 1 isoform X2 n=1 Tax=Folsomia candida TaxID=158441 RepID=UPI000B8F6753|nr:TOM1-like protein 1 isoform X2 [Folsomia candida]